MKKADIENDDYLIIHPNGDFTSSLKIDQDELTKKKVICLIPEFSYLDDKCSSRTISEINAFIRNNPSVSNVLMIYTNSTNSDFNFNDELNMEEFFCKWYKNIEQPEKIQLHVPSIFAANPDNCLSVVYEDFSLSRCKDIDQKIEMFIKDVKEADLSSFEKIMATHILCSRFMNSNTDYEENGKNTIPINFDENVFGSSMHILSDGEDGYKIKCSGYVDMFVRMLDKMNIYASPVTVFNVENGFVHTVAMVDVHDEKYSIDGRYICDLRSDSDFRKMREDLVNGDTNSSYFGRDSLTFFCLNVEDFEALNGIDKFSEAMNYFTKPGVEQVKDEISTDRLDISSISKALGVVSNHRFDLQNNLDYYLYSNNAIESILQDNKDTISFIRNSREFIDSSKNSSFSTICSSEFKLKEMLDSSKKNAINTTEKNKK